MSRALRLVAAGARLPEEFLDHRSDDAGEVGRDLIDGIFIAFDRRKLYRLFYVIFQYFKLSNCLSISLVN